MTELDEIKKRRLLELQQEQANVAAQEEMQLAQQVAQLENMVKPCLTPDALSRYGNLKIGHPQRAMQVLVLLAQNIQAGKIKTIDDRTLKLVLTKMQEQKREIKIKRK